MHSVKIDCLSWANRKSHLAFRLARDLTKMRSKKGVFLIHVVVASFLVVLVESAGLYGLGPEVPQLLQINPTTGQTTPVGNANLPKELTSQQLSSIDATKRIYYMVSRVRVVFLCLNYT